MLLRTIGSGLSSFLLLVGVLGACVGEGQGVETPSTETKAATSPDSTTLAMQVTPDVTGTDNPPHAAFGVVCISLTCSADAEASSDDVFIANYSWNWGDGTVTSGGSSASAPSHTYASFNTYTIVLTVTDSAGQTGSASQVVFLLPPPTAAFTFTCSTRHCSFDASGSSSNGLSITNYHWDWDDETTTDTTAPTTTHDFTFGATFQVHLTVTDAKSDTGGITHSVVVP